MNGSPRVEVHADAGELATSVAGELLRVLAGAQAAGRIPHVVLTGGSIADAIHREVARLSAASGVDWGSVELWWGDERFVARDSADRNAVQAREAFLDAVGVAEHRVHEVAATGEAADVEAAAAAYADELAAHGPDEFDVLMLGVGPDGHIASLFPDRPELAEVDRPTVPVTDSPKPPPERVSLTYPTLARSRATWLLVSGEPKAEAVARALSPAGTTVEGTVSFDNSATNPHNQFNPPRRVRWGLESTDEMGSVIFSAVPASEADLDEFNAAVRDHVVDEARLMAERRFGERAGSSRSGRAGLADRLEQFRNRRPGGNSRNRLGGDWRGRLGARLKELDKNNNGEIEPDEIDERSRRYIRFIDTNKDGRVSKEELSQISDR